jgi:hypothetical protein
MNLSDHESSESDGDTDAMCGNGDGYPHPYVPLMTNCMEYLHSYTSPYGELVKDLLFFIN